ncbi:MAG: hypothetical protein LN413_00085 [Candidatus Thermoplasmatota archaeon]|nr:hypothetical protein [Candidatus Thermoplasmatota archaeon]
MTDGNDYTRDPDFEGRPDSFGEPTSSTTRTLCLECLHDHHSRCWAGACACPEGEEAVE